MTCTKFAVDGVVGIVCTRPRRRRASAQVKRCACGTVATRLCDGPGGLFTTCSAPLCAGCTTKLHELVGDEGKDLCPACIVVLA